MRRADRLFQIIQVLRRSSRPITADDLDQLATAVANNRNKGDLVAVEGRLHYTRWQDADGNDRYGCEIIADRIDFY